MLEFTVRGPTGPAVVYRFESDLVRVGRASGNHLVLGDEEASRFHAELEATGEGWVLRDLGSRNGLHLNGTALTGERALTVGDVVRIGRTELVFGRAEAGAEPEGTGGRTRDSDWSGRGSGSGPREPVLVGSSSPMQSLRERVQALAATDITVLVTGESGTGKELVARLLHRQSARLEGPLLVVNCPALPGTLLDSELFGVEEGVATGVQARPGRLELSQGGTVFLDEVGDLEPAAQARLLRFLQERVIERVGGRKEIRVDARVVAATNQDLKAAVEAGSFRADLYHRLVAAVIELPPLRERAEDVSELAEFFLARPSGPERSLGEDASSRLRAYAWPGNVRELEQVIELARHLAKGATIGAADLPDALTGAAATGGGALEDAWSRIVGGGESFWELVHAPFLARELSKAEVRAFVERAWREGGDSYKGAAKLLGLDGEYKRLMNFVDHHGLGVKR